MKKQLLIALVLMIILSCVVAGCTKLKSKEQQATGTIQVPGGPTIEVVFNGPPELKMEWEKLGMAPDGFQVQLVGTLKNVSNQLVTFSEIAFLFDGRQVDFLNPLIGFPKNRALSPGEEIKVMKGFPGYTESTKVLEVKIKGFEKIGGEVTTKPPTPTEVEAQPKPTTPTPAPEKVVSDDIEWLATVIASEAGSVFDKGRWVRCTDEERATVGWTVLNRLRSGSFGRTIKEVATAPGQYAHNQEPTQEIKELATKLLEGQIPDNTGGATHFFSPISMPKEGESTAGFDVDGGLHEVSGVTKGVYFPSWTKQLDYVGDLDNVRPAYFMFYGSAGAIRPKPPPAPTPSVMTGRIAFLSYRGDELGMYVMNEDGSNQQRLARVSFEDCVAVWSPDGKQIAFHSEPEGSYRNDIYVMAADGASLRNLTNSPDIEDREPAWSPDGKHITFAYGEIVKGRAFYHIYVMQADGSNQQQLTAKFEISDRYTVWSPDGRNIAFVRQAEFENFGIWLMNADGSNQRKVAEPGDDYNALHNPAWSPDGKQIAFLRTRLPAPRKELTEKPLSWSELWIMNSDGSGQRRLAENVCGGNTDKHTWSPDGRHIAFVTFDGDNNTVTVISVDGSERYDFALYGGDNRAPTWSTSGGEIAFHSNRDGNWEIYVANIDGSHLRNLTNNPGEDWLPAWSP